MPIGIGSPAIDRATYKTGNVTYLILDNPSTGAGTLTTVYVWASNDITGFKVGTFYGSGSLWSCRDAATIGNVTGGAKQTFTVSLSVESGDVLGFYHTLASGRGVEFDTSGYGGVKLASADTVNAGDGVKGYLSVGMTAWTASVWAKSTTDGAIAWGEQSPAAGESPLSWTLWDDGAAGPATVTGDADWGQLTVASGDVAHSDVRDLGSVKNRTITINDNRYQSGSGAGSIEFRGSYTIFTQDAGAPFWQGFSGSFNTSFRYIQLRVRV